ncbi:hypothetical protein FZEAL_3905 [Fusarium zealandicum]|uniref:Hydrophobin n=1 Tax=Fusarium zealandicum TaxID=1053134 RepID=A0A8H4UNQ3_9HYPO|nr:hypothetical protein FZEAL_3905 [Fusarium zealandicum]
MHASTVLCGVFLFLQGAMASPLGEPGQVLEPRDVEPEMLESRNIERRSPGFGDIPWPTLPSKKKTGKGSDCATSGSNTQTNMCSNGSPYCCTSDGNGGHTCQNSKTCTQTVICCNNNNGYQICMGDIDFNMPITININL